MKKNIAAFLDEIEMICKKYGLSISHEDVHGGFVIEDYNEEDMRWLRSATFVLSRERIVNDVALVAQKYDIEEVRLFGSYSYYGASEESDVDLIVKYGINCKGLACFGFIQELEETLCKKVDVLDMQCLPEFANERFLERCPVIYKREE